MKINYIRMKVLLMSLAIGFSSVWFYNNFQFRDNFYELSQSEADSVAFLTRPKGFPEFTPTGRGCGNGYVQGYETSDGQNLSEGVAIINKRDFRKSIKDAEIIERIEGAVNRNGEKGLRILTKNLSEKGNTYFEILWFGNGRLHYISAPTLELALKFEKSEAYAY
jgi:hypothetical protein